MKKVFVSILFFLLIVGLAGCQTKEKSDALKFKEEYESLNGTKSESGKTIRTITIDEDNPFVYKDASDIVNMVQNKESFVVYFGFSSCPWCRSVLPNLIKASNDLGIDKIYYVDVKEIRDTLKIDGDGKVVTESNGTDDYYKLLEIFDSVLSDYSLKDSNGSEIDTHEKRIYAPNIISVVDGKVQELATGISTKQTDGYMKLTNEMNQESYDLIKCAIRCVADSKNTCSPKSMC